MEITPNPDPTHLPFTAEDIHSTLQVFKGNKSSGPSFLPSQLIKHLHGRNNMVISELFKHFVEHGIPKAWNLVQVTPVHKCGNQADAKNYRPVSVMGPLAKLYACCLNLELETRATFHAWRAPTQAGFRRHYYLEDLIMPVDYLLARAQTHSTPLALCLVDLEKAFDLVPHQHLLDVLSNTYGINACMLETICWVLVDTWGQVPGGKQPFRMNTGVKQGCPMLPLLLGLYFDHVVKYIKTHTATTDVV